MAGEPPTGATPEAGVTRWREDRNEMLSLSRHFHSSASIHHFNSVAGKRMTALAKLGHLNLTAPLWGSLLHWGRNFLLTSAPLECVLVKHPCPACGSSALQLCCLLILWLLLPCRKDLNPELLLYCETEIPRNSTSPVTPPLEGDFCIGFDSGQARKASGARAVGCLRETAVSEFVQIKEKHAGFE